MRQFWVEILLAAVVGVFAIMFLAGSFTPQKDAQGIMADSTNQSISSVKTNVSTTAPAIVGASDVINAVTQNAASATPVNIFIKTTVPAAVVACYQETTTASFIATSTGFTTNVTSIATGSVLTVVSDLTKYYTKMQGVGSTDILYIQQ